MFITILTWLLISSILFILSSIFNKNVFKHFLIFDSNDLNDDLSDRYVMCLFWPAALIINIFIGWFIIIKLIFKGISWSWKYLGEIYWDILYFKAFMQQTLQKPW